MPSLTYAIVFGRNLRAHRMRLGLTQVKFAARLAKTLSPSYVCNLEKGRENPTLRQMERLAQALGLPLEAMLDPRVMSDKGRS